MGTLLWWSCRSPAAHSWGLLNHANSFHRGAFWLNAKFMQTYCPTHSVILNVTATQYTCSLNSVYHPHWLVEWSHHCSGMHILVYSTWLPGYIDVMQTILIILTMAELFLDKPPMLEYTKMILKCYIKIYKLWSLIARIYKSEFCHLLIGWSYPSYLISLCLSFSSPIKKETVLVILPNP